MRLRFGSFELDEPRFELRHRGHPVAVQPKVLDLILYLARHRGRLVSKDELFREVWAGVAVSDAALSQAVRSARLALGDSDAHPAIETVRSKGFRFVAKVDVLERPLGLSANLSRPTTNADVRVLETTSDSLKLETEEDGARLTASEPRVVPHLFVAIHCDRPELGSARYSLEALDEVVCGRGSRRRAARETGDITRALKLSLPDTWLSREHAHLVKTREGWVVVDAGAKNGTFVNRRRVERQPLESGDVIECGHTLLLYEEHTTAPALSADSESCDLQHGVCASLLPTLQAQWHVVKRIARTHLPILITGEPGCRKGVHAEALHRESGRPGPFVSVDCAELLSARSATPPFGEGSEAPGRRGVPETPAFGTLCLEHVELLSRAAQASLARTLERGELAATETRLLATTAADLERLSQEGRFSGELLAHLRAFRLEVPPLRARRGDLGWLVAEWMAETNTSVRIAPDAALLLLRYSWPGNSIEFRNCIERAIALSGSERIDPEHLPEQIRRTATTTERLQAQLERGGTS